MRCLVSFSHIHVFCSHTVLGPGHRGGALARVRLSATVAAPAHAHALALGIEVTATDLAAPALARVTGAVDAMVS